MQTVRTPKAVWTIGFQDRLVMTTSVRAEKIHIWSEYHGQSRQSKQSIINYLAIDKAFKNTQKSEWHERVIFNFQKTKLEFLKT